jgi:hypothetical protein
MKNIGIFLATAILILFSFTNSGLAQNNLDAFTTVESKLKRIEADLGKRLSELKTEKEAMNQEYKIFETDLAKFTRDRISHNVKCKGQNFDPNNESEMQTMVECDGENKRLNDVNKNLEERKGKIDKRDEKYKEDFAQLKLDMNAWQAEKNIVAMAKDALQAFKDQGLKNWVVKNVGIEIRTGPGQQDRISPWAGNFKLIFTKRFLTETAAMRENLMAFEAGKVLWVSMIDKSVGRDELLKTWFANFFTDHQAIIEDMHAAKHQNEGLSDIGVVDPPWDSGSTFGYIFRAQALQLPEGQEAQPEWKKAIREFQAHINPLLRDK